LENDPWNTIVNNSFAAVKTEHSTSPGKFVDIEKILREKANKLYKRIPRFLLRWLKRKLHEDDINDIMWQLRDKKGLDYNNGVLELLGARVESLHRENIPAQESLIVVSNHPLGGMDGMALIGAVGKVRRDIHFFVNDILKNLKNYGELFVAVNKLGTVSAGSLRNMEQVLDSGSAVLIFPAGLVSRKQHGRIRDLSWKKTFVTQAIDHQKVIVPAFIEGENSSFFYNFARWRKRLGIKGNLEMLLLPDEMFSASGKKIRIHFGKPFSYSVFDSRRTHKQWADLVYEFVYSPELLNGLSFEEYLEKTSRK
jgi:1-acyl-sn-glycerol-3-phosphate acyltransferase